MSADAGAPLIGRLCVIGVGLIGGSLARALRAAGQVGEVIGCGRGERNLQRACELGVIDRYHADPAAAAAGADMTVLAVPMGAMAPVLAAVAGAVPDHGVVTDVGSSKASVVEQAQRELGAALGRFVPGHPVAGTENSGVEASFAELFERRRVILTPLAETEVWALNKVRAMWQTTGAEVIDMGARHHDEVLAATSHLPHMLAYTLVDSLARMDDRAEIFRYAAGGFRDFTRIASSDPVMWRDVCLANRGPLLEVLRRFGNDLAGLADAIDNGDGAALLELFKRSKHARDNLYLDLSAPPLADAAHADSDRTP